MKKVLTTEEAIRTANNIHIKGESIVLVGGCFDILHIGHIEFLEKSKKQGDILFILLESDEKIKKIKGNARPINNQTDRARILASIKFVDYVVLLPCFRNNKSYDDLISSIKPAIIATTKGDPYRKHKERQAKMINCKVVDVVNKVYKKSTSKLAKLLMEDYYL